MYNVQLAKTKIWSKYAQNTHSGANLKRIGCLVQYVPHQSTGSTRTMYARASELSLIHVMMIHATHSSRIERAVFFWRPGISGRPLSNEYWEDRGGGARLRICHVLRGMSCWSSSKSHRFCEKLFMYYNVRGVGLTSIYWQLSRPAPPLPEDLYMLRALHSIAFPFC